MRGFFILSLSLALVACDLVDTPTGKFVEEKDITQTGDPEFLTKGCDAQGNPVLGIDPAMKVGTTIGQVMKIQTAGVGSGEVAFTTKTTAVGLNAITQQYTVDKVENFSGYTKGQVFNVQCRMQGDQIGCATDGPTNTGAEHSKYEDCQFTAQPSITGKLMKGKYSFSNGGPTVTAFKLTLTGTAPIKCGTETFPEAKVEQSILSSNDIPSADFNFCGGTAITFYAKISGNGKVLKATFSERTTAGTSAFAATSIKNGALVVPFERYFDTDFITTRPAPLRLSFEH